MADLAPNPRHGWPIRPATTSGWLSLAVLALSLLLLAARITLKPALGLPLNYLMVFVVAAASGLIALYAVILRRERAVGVLATLLVGLLAGVWLVAEWLGGSPA